MQQGLKSLQNRAANHRRNQYNISSSSKLSKFGASDNEKWYYCGHDEDDSYDDSDSGDREVQNAKSKSSSLECKFSSIAIDGADWGVLSSQTTLYSVSGRSEYRNVLPSHECVLSADVK